MLGSHVLFEPPLACQVGEMQEVFSAIDSTNSHTLALMQDANAMIERYASV
jgi:hypothetical protein